MSDRGQIVEAMVEQYDDHMLGENWGDDGVGYVGCDCGLWFGKASEGGWDLAKEHVATAALDAAWPLIRQAVAERVRAEISTYTVARELIRAGMSVGEVDARDAALEKAARLIEGAEL